MYHGLYRTILYCKVKNYKKVDSKHIEKGWLVVTIKIHVQLKFTQLSSLYCTYMFSSNKKYTVGFGDLNDNTFKCLTSLLSIEQEIQYDEHT
jgi:hypothetical protein